MYLVINNVVECWLIQTPLGSVTAKRILERLGISVCQNLIGKVPSLKPISYSLGVYTTWFLSRNYWSSLYHYLMASI